MNHITQAIRDVRRDWRLTDVRLLVVALMVAVTAVTTVSFFTQRVDHAMRQQATAMLGADLIIQSSRPIPASYQQLADSSGLQSVIVTEFPSVAISGDHSALAQIKAVGSGYPLRGHLEIASRRGEPGLPATHIPPPGEAWVEDRVMLKLEQYALSPNSLISLGNSTFRITQLITFEPDRGGSAFQLAPRILINHIDLPATGLISPASRASYKLLVAGEKNLIETFDDKLAKNLQPYERLQSLDDGRPEISDALSRASRFMALASMLTVILSGAAVALAAHGFSQREINRVAILRTLGAVRKTLWINYSLRLFTLLCAATLIGSLIGFIAQLVLAYILEDWLQTHLPATSLAPLLTGFGTAALTLAGFALPPVMRLLQTPPMRILRSDISAPPLSIWLTLLLMAATIMALLAWQANDWALANRVFGGIIAALGIILLGAWLIITMIRVLLRPGGGRWRFGLANLSRFRSRSTLLIATFATGILTLTLLGSVRGDLINAWENNVPLDAPNFFLINIQPEELSPLQQFLAQRQIKATQLYPLVLGRLLKINDREVTAADFKTDRAKRMVNREFNLSASSELSLGNTIIEGQWFTQDDKDGLSIEEGIAQTLGLKLGDSLVFDVAGEPLEARITSLRKVEWNTMQPNFFVMLPTRIIQQLPATYITSLFVPDSDKRFSTDLVKQFPSVTTLDVKAILLQVRRIIDQASRAVEYVFLFTLLAGIVVLIAAIQTQRSERRQEIALLKSFGAASQQIRHAVAVEFALIGGLAGLLGSSLATLIGWMLASQVFDLSYSISWMQIIIATLAGSLLTAMVGLLVVRQMLRTQPMVLLQDS